MDSIQVWESVFQRVMADGTKQGLARPPAALSSPGTLALRTSAVE